MTDKEKLARLIEVIKNYVPYVTATISPNNAIPIHDFGIPLDNPSDWMAIHRGRAGSSHQQLEYLLRLAKEFENV